MCITKPLINIVKMEMLYDHNNSNDRRKRPRRNILNQPSYSLSNNHHHAIMKFLHHHQCHDKKAEQPPLQSPSMSLTKQVDAVQDEFIAVISAMQESESSTGAYDPMGRYSYSDKDDKLSSTSPLVNVDCRSRMLGWCSNMIDYFEVDRSIIAIALYYQDRFLGTEKGKAVQNDRSLFRVVSVTSLYMALKIYVPERWNITAHAFSKLCQGAVSAIEICEMETNILFALDWHVNPPSPMQYVKALLDLIFYSASERTSEYSSREHILELVSYQLDTALDDMRLLQVRSFIIGTASLLNALEGVMKEGHPEDTSEALFDQDCIDLVLGIIQSEGNELRYVQSILLNSVVSKDDDGSSSQDDVNEKSDAECSATEVVERSTESSPQSVSSPPPSQRVSSSPTSASKLFWTQSKVCGRTLTPQSVLSKVVAHHFI